MCEVGAVEPARQDVSELLNLVREGNDQAKSALFEAVYAELRRIAHRRVAREPSGATLQTTALVHEAYIRLTQGAAIESIQNHLHFFATAARVMRNVLADHARKRDTEKRGGQRAKIALDDVLATIEADHRVRFVELDAALSELSRLDASQADIVELRFFAGLALADVARQLAVSVSTVEKEFRSARAWLNLRLK